MIKVKDGYAKLIGTTYAGSADRVLLSNGGDIGKAVASTANTLVLRNSSGLIESTLAIGTAPFKVISTTLVNNLNSNYLEGLKRRYRIQLDNVTDTGPYCKLMTIKTNSPYIDQPITFKYSLRTSGSGSTHEGYVTIKILGKPVSISVTGDLDHNNRFYLYTISEEVITGDTTTYIGTHELYFKGGSWTSGDFWDIHWGDATKSIVVHENQKTGLQEPTNYIRVLQSTTGRIGGSVHKVVVTQNNTANAYYPLIWASPADETTSDSQLYKSYSHLTYNPNLKRITVNQLHSKELLLLSAATEVCLRYADNDVSSVVLSGTYFKPYDGANGKLNLGSSSARWLGIYGNTLDLSKGFTAGGLSSITAATNTPLHIKSTSKLEASIRYTGTGGTSWIAGTSTKAESDTFGIWSNTLQDNAITCYSSGDVKIKRKLTSTNFVSTVATGTQPYACSSTTLNTNLNADLLDGVHLAGHGGKEGVMRSWKRGTYTTVNLYFGNGNVVVIDPKPTDGSTLSNNTIIFSLGDSSIRNTLLAFMYERDEIKYRRVVDGPTWEAWKTIAFTDSNISGTAAYANILKSNNTTSVPTGLLFYAGWIPQGNTSNRSWCGPTGDLTVNSVKGDYGSVVRVNYDATHYNELFFDANSTRPSWRNVTGTTSTGWKTLGLQEDIRPSGFVTSDVAGLSSYWGKLWECTRTTTNSDVDLTFYIHPALDSKRGFIHIKVRRYTTTTDGVTNYTNKVNMLLVSGNIPTSEVRLYHDAATGKMELWVDVKKLWGVYNAVIISCTTRVTQEIIPILGTLYSNRFTTALTLPTYSYITLSNLNSHQIHVLLHTTNNTEYPLVWSNLNNGNQITADLLFKSYSHLTYNPHLKRITAFSFRAENSIYSSGQIELHGSTPYIDFHYNNSTEDFTNRIIEGLAGQLTVTGKFRIGLAHSTSTDYNFYVNGTSRFNDYITTKSIYPSINYSYDIGSTSAEFRYTFTRGIAVRHLDASAIYSGDTNLYIGYGWTAPTAKTCIYTSSKAEDGTISRTEWFLVNSKGSCALTRLGVNGLDTSYNFYVNGTSYMSSTLTMNGVIVAKIGGSLLGIKFGSHSLNSLNNQLIWQSPEAIRFGSTDWDWNSWAGLKYNHSNKIIYLGLADGTIFNANSAQSGGKVYFPGVSNLYTGNGANLIWHAGNDGSGSGLDADLLDGLHLSYIVYTNNKTDLSSENNPGYILHYTNPSATTNTPYSIIGGNQCTVLQVLPGNSTYTALFAIGFGSDYPAIRRRGNTTTWGAWSKIKAGYADSAAVANRIVNSGTHAEAASSRTNPASKFEGTYYTAGMFMTSNYLDSSTPCSFGNIITTLGSGGGLLLLGWEGTYKTGKLYYRSHRDNTETGGWTPWKQIAFTDDITTYYWANIPISATSSTTTTPTFGSVFINTGDATLKMYSGRITDAKSDGNVCLQTSIDGTDGLSHAYPTQHGSRCNLVLQPRGGQVYIGTNPDGGNANYKLYVNGAIYGTSFAGPAKSISTISMTGGDGNTAGYRLMYTWSLSAWSNYRMVFAVASRHAGSGTVCIECSCNSATLNYDNVTAQIHYFGNFGNVSIMSSEAFLVFVSADGSKAYLFWRYNDYNTTSIIPLLNATSLSNGTWVTTIDAATYGTRKAITIINPTTVGTSDSNGNYRMVFNSGHNLYNTAGIYCNPSTDSLYATHFYETSDIKFKHNIKNILTSDNIPELKEFDWKKDGSHSYGLIAQELEELGYSELVSTNKEGYKTVNYSAALSLIVGKLQVKIRELEKEIESLKNKN